MRNMFALSLYKEILQALSKAHCCLSFGLRSRLMQSRNKSAAFLESNMKIICKDLLLCTDSLHHCT